MQMMETKMQKELFTSIASIFSFILKEEVLLYRVSSKLFREMILRSSVFLKFDCFILQSTSC